MIPAVDRWGPFADCIDPGERVARLRCLRAITHLSCGPRAADLVGSLKGAEVNPDLLPGALAALNGLASLDRRRILASYAALNIPVRQLRGHRSSEDCA